MFGGFTLNGFQVNQLFREGGGAPKSPPPPDLSGLRNHEVSEHWNYSPKIQTDDSFCLTAILCRKSKTIY